MATTPNIHPVLENGDHLTREEFNRRYQLRSDIRVIESAAFPGLRLNVVAMLAGDTALVLTTLGFRHDPPKT